MEGLKKRAEGVRYNEDGSCKSNKRHGKSINDVAPSSILNKLENKVKFLGGTYDVINAKDAKATGTDHTKFNKSNKFSEYTKEEYYTHIDKGNAIKLSNGVVHDRDAHAAFNLKHFNPKTKEYDILGLKENYPDFCNAEKEAFERKELDIEKLKKYQSTVEN